MFCSSVLVCHQNLLEKDSSCRKIINIITLVSITAYIYLDFFKYVECRRRTFAVVPDCGCFDIDGRDKPRSSFHLLLRAVPLVCLLHICNVNRRVVKTALTSKKCTGVWKEIHFTNLHSKLSEYVWDPALKSTTSWALSRNFCSSSELSMSATLFPASYRRGQQMLEEWEDDFAKRNLKTIRAAIHWILCSTFNSDAPRIYEFAFIYCKAAGNTCWSINSYLPLDFLTATSGLCKVLPSTGLYGCYTKPVRGLDLSSFAYFAICQCFFMQISRTKTILLYFQSADEYFRTECKDHTPKRWPFYFSHWGRFSWTFAPQTNRSSNHDGCVNRHHDTTTGSGDIFLSRSTESGRAVTEPGPYATLTLLLYYVRTQTETDSFKL